MPFDPDGPTTTNDLFGLPHSPETAAVVVVPVPFDATASGRRGAMSAPEGIRVASGQVDLHDLDYGDVWRAGIAMDPVDDRLPLWNDEARAAVDRVRMRGDHAAATRCDALGDQVEGLVQARVQELIGARRIPVVLGGDHSVAVGAIRGALGLIEPLGVLQIDAHADMRPAYEGLRHSHASVMHQITAGRPSPSVLVQVGVRDVGPAEWRRVRSHEAIRCWTDDHLARRQHEGVPFERTLAAIIEPLPPDVWLSVDVDGLDPALCPSTGTPVPGGLSWREATALIRAVAYSGRRIVGCDLVEVGPEAWDCQVGARLLFKLCGAALVSQGWRHPQPLEA